MPKKIKYSAINVSLPRSQREWIEQRVERGGFGTVSAYIGELIRRDQRDQRSADLELTLLQAIKANASSNLEGDGSTALKAAEVGPSYNANRAKPSESKSGIEETFELFSLGKEMMRQNLRREKPHLSPTQIDTLVDKWLHQKEALPFERSAPERLLQIING